MSEVGERTCPLCAEEMDLTDQHLKPCKCGYEICVWCWHHIMDMAEKDEMEGRCPACRTPYNKEKIVGMTANCEKLVSEMSVEKKLKSQKGKSRTSEGRKQLGSVRVIQRNLVYVVGLPLNFADEDLLQRKDYFGQYGKVLKVSISRTASGAIQQFANSTCSVYITYSKVDEAIRCIQLINGFVLDARPLRACFGTTKYCHAWLRNMPCSNPDCLYLHEIGSQEDSFTKDEVISAYSRSRVQQITGATNCMQRRSGNVLPPPVDEFCNNSTPSSEKIINKTATSTNLISASCAGLSPPNSSCGRSTAVPAGASWGTRASSNLSFSTSPCSNSPLRPDLWNNPVASSEVVSLAQVSVLQSDNGEKPVLNEVGAISHDENEMETVVSEKKKSNSECIVSTGSSLAFVHPDTSPISQQPHFPQTAKSPANSFKMVNSSIKSSRPTLDDDSLVTINGNKSDICSEFLSMGIRDKVEQISSPMKSGLSEEVTNVIEDLSAAYSLSDPRLGILTPERVDQHEKEDDLLSFDNQRLKDPEVVANKNHIPDFFNSFRLSKHSDFPSQFNISDGSVHVSLDQKILDREGSSIVSVSSSPSLPTGQPYNFFDNPDVNGVEYSNVLPNKDKRLLLARCEGEQAAGSGNSRESSIISNILSLDFDTMDKSLTSPRDLVNFLGETDKRQGAFGLSNPWKIQNSNQSRFSFAREEESMNRISNFGPSADYVKQDFKRHTLDHDLSCKNSLLPDKFISHNDFHNVGCTESDYSTSNHSHFSSNKLSISRSQISAPPGFSGPSRSSPPGFSSYGRTDQISNALPGNHVLDASSLLRNQWQTPPRSSSFSNGDIEFIDPAILEVRHGTVPGVVSSSGIDIRSNFSPQLSTPEEVRLQSFLQRSHPSYQNQRMSDLVDSFSPIGDAYGVRSRVIEQTLVNNFSPFSQFAFPQSRNDVSSTEQWNGWNDGLGGNNLNVAQILRNEKLGFNKAYGSYEESKVRMPTSGNIYNGAYGI